MSPLEKKIPKTEGYVLIVLQDTIQVQAKQHVANVQQDHGQAEVLVHVLSAQQVHFQFLKEQLQPQLVVPVLQVIFPLKGPPHVLLVQKAPIQMEESARIAQQEHRQIMLHQHVVIVLQDNLQLQGVNVFHVQQANPRSQEVFAPFAVLDTIRALGLLHVRHAHQGSIPRLELPLVAHAQQDNI